MNQAVKTNNLHFSYNNKAVLKGITASFKQGELTCLLGPNGAGKTTLINLMLGRIQPTNGAITWFNGEHKHSRVKERIGAMLQNSTAPDKAKVCELIKLFASYYPKPLSPQKLISDLELGDIADKLFKHLSGGQKQLVLFALALSGDPQLLFLDEPTVGMDINVQRRLWAMIEEIKAQGKTIILTTHYLAEADALADRIMVLNNGELIANAAPEKIKADFQQKRIKAKTNKTISWLQQLPCVSNVVKLGNYYEIISTQTTSTLKQWLSTDSSLSDLTVEELNLEMAFLNLTKPSLPH